MGQPVHCKLKMNPATGRFDVVDKGLGVLAEIIGGDA